MFEYLKALAARIARRGGDRLPPAFPDDPYAGVREPRKRGPGGRNTAVALDEPVERGVLQAHAQRRGRALD